MKIFQFIMMILIVIPMNVGIILQKQCLEVEMVVLVQLVVMVEQIVVVVGEEVDILMVL